MELTLRTITDTATPQPVIPIFLIHTIKAPLCNQPGCWCQANNSGIVPLLAALEKGECTVSEANSFADDTAR